jgi:hypothetical protein
MKAVKKSTESPEVEIHEISFSEMRFPLLGTSPLIMNRFSAKAWHELLLPSARTKNRASLEQTLKHDPLAEFQGSLYKTKEQSSAMFHFPTGAFHKSIAQAAIDLPGAKRAQIERLTKVTDVNIQLFGVPQIYMAMVRNSDINRTPDVRTRSIFPQWACVINVRFVRSIITHRSVAHLVSAAGALVGIGDWRSEKGGGYGAFEVVDDNDKRYIHLLKTQARAAQEEAYLHPDPFDTDTEDIFTWFNTEVKRREKEGHLKQIDLPNVRVHIERGNAADAEYLGTEPAGSMATEEI